MSEQPYQPDVAAIAADLADDGVHLDPQLAGSITDDQLANIVSALDSLDPPVRVLLVPLDYDTDLSALQLVSLVHREAPADGVYFVSMPSYDGQWRLETTSYGVDVRRENVYATYVAPDLYPSDAALQMLHALELYSSGTARETFDAMHRDESASTTSAPSDGGMPQVLGVDLAWVGLVVLAVAAGAWARRVVARRRKQDGLRVNRRALQRISSAQTQEWRRRAQDETDALGQRIKSLSISAGADHTAWTAALDHFDAATTVLDRSADAADSIGALVLARRGDDALDHALAGQSWSPSGACFFNPLHGTATTRAEWATDDGDRDVPACRACGKQRRRHREPDFLDLPVGNTVVHYIDADVEPWASTGYGSLDPDLLARL